MVSFVSAGASGIALLLGIFLLQETNPRVLAKRGVKDVELVEVKSGAMEASGEGVEVVGAEIKDAKTVDAKTVDANSNDAKTVNANATDAKTADAKTTDANAIDSKPTDAKPTDAKTTEETTPAKLSRPKITKLMILCFVHEFCIRWTAMAYNSRYNIYITDRWNVSSLVFSLALPTASHE